MTTTRPARAARQTEQGAVLVIVLLIMMVLLGLGMTALWLTSGNLQIGANMTQRGNALYCAEAGIERARGVLNSPTVPDLDAFLRGSNAGVDNIPTSVDPTTGQPNGVGAILMDGVAVVRNVAFPPATFGRSAGTVDNPLATQMGTYTVWIRNDLGEMRQGAYTDDSNGTVVIRSQGIATDGRTNVVLEVTMIPSALISGAPPAAAGANPGGCYAGKNACDDGSSTQYGLMINLN
jgi:Tfp pilus assembly protein PilX